MQLGIDIQLRIIVAKWAVRRCDVYWPCLGRMATGECF